MKKFRRVFLIVADSFGVGAAPTPPHTGTQERTLWAR